MWTKIAYIRINEFITRSAWVGCPIPSVCLEHNSKTKGLNVFKLVIGMILEYSRNDMVLGVSWSQVRVIGYGDG